METQEETAECKSYDYSFMCQIFFTPTECLASRVLNIKELPGGD